MEKKLALYFSGKNLRGTRNLLETGVKPERTGENIFEGISEDIERNLKNWNQEHSIELERNL